MYVDFCWFKFSTMLSAPVWCAGFLYFLQAGRQAGVDLLANSVGVTLGPMGRNVVLQNKYGGPRKIVNDGVPVCKEV